MLQMTYNQARLDASMLQVQGLHLQSCQACRIARWGQCRIAGLVCAKPLPELLHALLGLLRDVSLRLHMLNLAA